MTEKIKPVRKTRADAQRNRELLLDTAKAVFAQKGAATSLEEIARAAGVGIGTLYRHFPTRDALIEAVYRNEVERLAAAATRLARRHPPVAALREWLLVFVEYLATKRGMAEVLGSISGGAATLYAESGVRMKQSVAQLVARATESGDLHLEMEPLELLRAISSVAGAGPNGKRAAGSLVDILIAGMRTR